MPSNFHSMRRCSSLAANLKSVVKNWSPARKLRDLAPTGKGLAGAGGKIFGEIMHGSYDRSCKQTQSFCLSIWDICLRSLTQVWILLKLNFHLHKVCFQKISIPTQKRVIRNSRGRGRGTQKPKVLKESKITKTGISREIGGGGSNPNTLRGWGMGIFWNNTSQ